ncbi:MAG TPA: hypothetical protein VM870_07865 [Pyrinomonadaceae bacterium]|nr:hypothetical protein [Pyrinomonadaceae bacterium]
MASRNLLLQDINADPVERSSAMVRIGVDKLTHFKPVIADLLRHQHFILRGEAIKVLLGKWNLPEYVEEGVQMLRHDLEWSTRADAASALSWFAFATGKQTDLIARELVRSLKEDENRSVHEEAYSGLLRILTPERKQSTIPDDFNRERDVDWELLKPYLP